MSAKFSAGKIKEKELIRQALAADVERFLASGRLPTQCDPKAVAVDYSKKKSQMDISRERKARQAQCANAGSLRRQ